MRRATLLTLVLLACRAEPRPASLADRVEQRIRAANLAIDLTRKDEQTLLARTRDGIEITLSLDNLRDQCRTRPGECDGAIDITVASLGQQLATLGGAKTPPRPEDVRAVLKDTLFVDQMKEQVARAPADKAEDNSMVLRPLASDLWIAYVIDTPTSTMMITGGTMRELKLDPDGLHDLAMRNLGAALTDLPHQPIAPGSKVHMVNTGDDYEASRLLVPKLCEVAARAVAGHLVAAAPARHIVLFTGDADPADVAALSAAATRLAASEHHPISASLLEWTGQGWKARAPR